MNSTDQPDAVPAPVEPAAPVVAFRDVPWTARHVAVGSAPLVACVAIALSPLAGAIHPFLWLLGFALVELWMIAFPLALARRYGWRPRLAVPPQLLVREFLLAILFLLALWALLAGGYVVWVALFGEPPESVNPADRTVRSGNPGVFFLLAAVGVGVAPVTEELFFRGMLYRALRRFAVRPLAVLVQAAAFGALHLNYGPTHAVATGFMGVFLALVYDLRKTLLTPILCHALNNAAVFALLLSTVASPFDPPALGIDGAPHESGLIVTKVSPGSGAEAAGIKPGDVLHTIDGWGVRNLKDARNAIRDKRPGDTVAVEYIRDGLMREVDVVLRSRKELSP